MTGHTTLKRYYIFFTLIYVAVLAVIIFLNEVLGIKMSKGINLVALISSAAAVVPVFVQDNKRRPTKQERKRLAFGSTIISILVSLLAVVITSFGNETLLSDIKALINTLNPLFIVGITFVVTLIYYLILSCTYSWFGKMFAKSIDGLNK